MSAQEMIEQFKVMPTSERTQVIAYVRDLPAFAKDVAEAAADEPDYRALALKIMGEHDELFRKLAQ